MDELEITPAEVKGRLDRGEKFHLVDARRPTAAGEPARERLRQGRCVFEDGHTPELASG